MRCLKCGFIYNGPERTCPYCGSQVDGRNANWLTRQVHISEKIHLTVIQLIKWVLANIYILALIVNALFYASIPWFLYSTFICVFLDLMLNIMAKKYDLCFAMRRLSYLVFCVYLVWIVARLPGLSFVANFIITLFIILGIAVETALLLFTKKMKVSRIVMANIVFFALSLGNFIVLRFFPHLIPGIGGTLIEVVLNYAALGMSALFLVNYAVIYILIINGRLRQWIN